jgi:membrane-bound lytic murein transglycosylase B
VARILALAVAGLAILSATAFAGGGRTPHPSPRVLALAHVAAPSALPVAAPEPDQPAVRRGVRLDPHWLRTTAQLAGIPAPALRAYARAQLDAPPGCALGWTTLAAIGWVESRHGTIGGRALHADGRPSSPILGPTLDGSGAVAAIPAEAAGTALHGDEAWDHAVGPMQFLPSSWAVWRRDGDADGRLDPQDLDDAAAAAAAYLCAGGSLTGSGWAAAVLSYNHDPGYVGLVHDAAEAYAARTS